MYPSKKSDPSNVLHRDNACYTSLMVLLPRDLDQDKKWKMDGRNVQNNFNKIQICCHDPLLTQRDFWSMR